MTEGDFFSDSDVGVASGAEVTIDPASAETGAVEIHTVAGTGSATVFKDVDVAGNNTFSLSFALEVVESPAQSWHSQGNKIELSSSAGHRLRIVNDDTAPRAYHVCGIEIID